MHRRTTIQGLSCEVQQGDDAPPRALVVLCHGYGAGGDDLVPLGHELLHRDPRLAKGVRFVFPAAPLSLPGYGSDSRAWWELDVERLIARQSGDAAAVARLREELPAGLPSARLKLLGLCAELTLQCPGARLYLGGFSQGAMLATDVALRMEEPPAALILLSGALICESEWAQRAPRRRGLRVLQSHGRQDAILDYAGAEALHALLTKAGLRAELHAFDGGHTIPELMLDRVAALLAEA